MMSGSRLASLIHIEELNELVANLPLTFDHWIGMYRGETETDLITLSDGRRTLFESDFAKLESNQSPNRTTCSSCSCVTIDETKALKFTDCSENHYFICEMKGNCHYIE